ncbi:hypothetical protein OG453_28775 [Streptomyces sp. NBC_01381]|nr:hypothetical protein [Streptomyces sp. NBC_01381]
MLLEKVNQDPSLAGFLAANDPEVTAEPVMATFTIVAVPGCAAAAAVVYTVTKNIW